MANHWPAHLDALPPCFHCNRKEWRWYDYLKRWVCRCYFEPQLRNPERYTTQPAQMNLEVADLIPDLQG